MADKIHKAERFCRKMTDRFPGSIDAANALRGSKADFGGDWPDWCDLPMAAVSAIITDGAPDPEPVLKKLEEAEKYVLASAAAALVWLKYKTIFTFDAELSDALANQPLDGDIPGQVLERLPYPCVFVEPEKEGGFFAWLEWDADLKMKELRILTISYKTEKRGSAIVPIVGNIRDAFNSLIASCEKRSQGNWKADDAEKVESSAKQYETVLPQLVNHVLYLCSDDPDMPDYAELRERRTFGPGGAAKRAAVVPVGVRIGAALRMAKGGAAGKQGGGCGPAKQASHSSPVAHMRRAHWHHYWTGPRTGERKLVLKWLPPVAVNADDEGAQAVIRKVTAT